MTRNQSIRREILMQLYAARPLACNAELIQRQARHAGLDYTLKEIRAECLFLVKDGHADEAGHGGDGAPRYEISAKGIIAYEQESA